MYQLHPQLARDCRILGEFPLCQVLLMNDSNYPWFILVPRVADITEIFQLSREDQRRLMDESSRFCEAIYREFSAHKINVAALGNVVPQLHVHHIVRYRDDPAWPAPVWGNAAPTPYTEDQFEGLRGRLSHLFNA